MKNEYKEIILVIAGYSCVAAIITISSAVGAASKPEYGFATAGGMCLIVTVGLLQKALSD
jgi:hypothetical protein